MSKRIVCRTGKDGYRTEERAAFKLEQLRVKFGDQESLHPYTCQHCGQWHLGRSPHLFRRWEKRWARKQRLAARRARPVWFLDVDGTLAPIGSGVTAADVETGQWALLYPSRPSRSGQVSDLSVPFRPAVVERIMSLRQRDLIEVRWLTTWEPSTLTAWTEVGLGPFRPARRVQQHRRRSWKSNVVETWLQVNADRRAIWTDDDLTQSRLRGFDRERLLAISPNPAKGLTDRQLDHIERWIGVGPKTQ